MKKMKAPKNTGERISDRENYLKNRTQVLEEFKDCLAEVQKDKPSVEGVIAGMDFQQFAMACVFRNIKEQEEYTIYNEKRQAPYIDIKEEKVVLKQMIKDAKKVFKDDYDKLYKHFNNEES
jgi:hypothetical protein